MRRYSGGMQRGGAGRVALGGLALSAALAAAPLAAQTADGWERATDPATELRGLHNLAGDVYVSCWERSGTVHVSVPGGSAERVTLTAGDASAALIEVKTVSGRVTGLIPTADPVLANAAAGGTLTVAGRVLDFSERDRRYFGLFLRICAL
ncbi:hypothetical protein ACFQ1E_13095 [Sphingomonas canadensis]|uniref:DUF5666 domain-containing protein n=1 Tax=Sphingomonas canadensis TaxID=1219257 RepID=A0ABW3H8F3_9SPHN|nr:hypothetical protein [Sphingomonas canadensis]MCW3837066.1 hypothetical protein [Sphingomonas canadensis]